MNPALEKLIAASDATTAIAGGHADYFPNETLAAFARMAIAEAGEALEQALCDLGLVEESDCGHFVNTLKRDGVEMPGGKEATHA